MKDLQRTYLELLHVARRLIASPEVEARWDQPSALQEYRMDALAGHLLHAATVTVIEGLATPAPTGIEPLSATEYWVSALRHPQWNDLDWDVHVRLREAGQRQAAGGYSAFLEEFDRLVQVVTAYLETEPDDRLVSVYAGHAASRLDEYLKSRVIECVVHIDDLAVSAAVETPALPALAMTVTIHELVEMARLVRGDLAVVRALSRRERDAINALRVI
jgi:hypothetical protein